MAKPETIARMFELLRANWPKYPFTDATTEVYSRCLKDISDQVLAAATAHCITACRFFPVIAELRQAAFDIMYGRINELTAQEAWGFLIRLANKPQTWWAGGQRYHRPELPILMKKALDAIGGWSQLAESDNYAADRARFIEAYTVFVQRERETVQMLPEIRELVVAMSLEKAIALESPETEALESPS